MAVLGNSNLTLADWSKRVHPDGSIGDIAELLSQTNEVLEDCVWKEGNLPTGDRVIIRTGLPTTYYRALNSGIPSSKSTTAQVDEACAIIEARSEMDVDLAKLNGNTNQFRLSEDSAFIESMNQTFVQGLFRGNPVTDNKQFLGLENRYNSRNSAVGNSVNVLHGGGSGSNNASIYLVGWSDRTVYCPFPKGSNAGLMKEDLGIQTIFDGTNRMQAYVSRFQWKPGLAVKDWRYVVRIANIDTGSGTDGVFTTSGSGAQSTGAATNIIKLMARAMDRIPSFGGIKPCFYMNRTLYSALRIQAMDRTQGVLDIEKGLSQFGTPMSWLTFQGIPVRKVDALTSTEAVVPA
jgi:hypothetical protein